MIDFDYYFKRFEEGCPVKIEINGGELRITNVNIVFKGKGFVRSYNVNRGICKKTFIKTIEESLNGRK